MTTRAAKPVSETKAWEMVDLEVSDAIYALSIRYYGGADTVCARASLNLPDLLNALVPKRRVELDVD